MTMTLKDTVLGSSGKPSAMSLSKTLLNLLHPLRTRPVVLAPIDSAVLLWCGFRVLGN